MTQGAANPRQPVRVLIILGALVGIWMTVDPDLWLELLDWSSS